MPALDFAQCPSRGNKRLKIVVGQRRGENAPGISLDQRSQTPPNQSQQSTRVDTLAEREARGSSWNQQTEPGSSSQKRHEGLLPSFSTKQYSQLPTPQSPSDSSRFAAGVGLSPESPIPLSQASYSAPGSFPQRILYRNLPEEAVTHPNPSQHILTPASSPFVSRTSSNRNDNPATPTHQTSRFTNTSQPTAPMPQFPVDSCVITNPVTPRNHGQPTASSSSDAEQPVTASTLSSPFMAKASVPGPSPRLHPVSSPAPPRTDSQPLAPCQDSSIPSNNPFGPSRPPGGEMERIRQAIREDQLSHIREAESRRPEYLKRAKRSFDEADPDAMDEDQRQSAPVGIMESPQKGRRLKLFQETSEESFEESLMAGGYGRYRTAEWVRQPQPISLHLAALPGTPNVVSQLEEVEEKKPPTEKELKKLRRLEAFRSSRSEGRHKAKLYPVELEGKGRVLLDIPNEMPQAPGEVEGSPSKKRTPRRKKKGNDPPPNDKKSLVDVAANLVAEDSIDKPNWTDGEFPWRLRYEEREQLAKAEEEERLKWIERFLDRDSDDEEPEGPPTSNDSEGEEALPPERWGAVYEHEQPPPVRPGRGKMVPLLAHPEDPRKNFRFKRSAFPSDPGDAKAALLAKRSVRALSYRQQRRERELHDDDSDAELCICHGYDDGRELVQCDDCQTWYHLECIGIRHISELGREEDPWFCRHCMTRSHSPSSEPSYDIPMPFFQPSIQDSPNWLRIPKTPTRPGRSGIPDLDYYTSSSSPWPDLRNPPSTPQGHEHHVRVQPGSSTYGTYDASRPTWEESPFDPTSTPSRGIRFHAPFATPKSQMWPRSSYNFQTPLRNQHRTSDRNSFGGPG
ncbi:hypothetical protein CC1G_11216 [Coprinopsis cinerea okayama7|uniref:PHD-type domain-containing protein n=1 Tax=Coprinopsis cinerea (strain Okayama-7 / 130 / ATCC MYA-4618 / FGSC 9003) TaxID=240176 RepID=A8N115_COPC7|nr:hypothetical protein CC1G_11216 [Coprinopsis cinerea okayama7\|eukprot:XP_001828564.2 hypothetical protein CC1G_11216 [Coprinopsis cinerea okayama7\